MKSIKYIFKLSLLCAFLLIKNVFAQAPEISWVQIIGGDSDDVAYDVEELWDGGFAVVGYTKSFTPTNFDVWFLRTDINGDTLWTKRYGGFGDDYGYSINKTEDGGFIVGGATNSFGGGGFDIYIIKIDSLGEILWSKVYGGVNNDFCWSILQTADNEYILTGSKDSYPLDEDVWIIKTDSNGDILWEKTYGSPLDDVGYSIQQTSDGGFVITGSTDCSIGSGNSGCNGLLLRVDSNGDTLWTKYFTGIQSDWFLSIELANDGGFIMTGRVFNLPLDSFANLWIVKVDSLGNEQWSNSFDYDEDTDAGYSIRLCADGGYIVTGYGTPFESDSEIWILKTNAVGDTLWTILYDIFLSNNFYYSYGDDFGYSTKQTSDGGYIIAGTISKHNPSFNFQLALIRLAPDIIPVELTSFTATAQQNAVSLNWQTATETNSSGFEIERKQVGSSQSSVSNQDWNQIAFVPGFGTTTEPKSYSFIDENLSAGKYQYRLKQIDFDGSFEYSNTVEVEVSAPLEFSLGQNYPNPFNPGTVISYSLPQKEFVTIKVIDILGREVATLVNEVKPAGKFEVEFDASSLASGVYLYQINAGSFTTSKKMLLTK